MFLSSKIWTECRPMKKIGMLRASKFMGRLTHSFVVREAFKKNPWSYVYCDGAWELSLFSLIQLVATFLYEKGMWAFRNEGIQE